MSGKTKVGLSVFTLAMMNVAAVMSLRGLPMMAEEGMTMIFYLLFASVLFLLPVSLVSAELATGWPQKGGVYRWVGEAFGPRWGFAAIWLQWIQNTCWYPTVLGFAAGCLSYLFLSPELANNKYFNVAVVLIVYWGATLVNFRGMKTTGKLTSAGVILGTIVPAALIILLGLIWTASGKPVEFLKTPHPLLPDLSSFNNIAFLAGIVLLFAGMEVGAVHVRELKNPKTEYPKAIFLAMIIIIVVFTLGSLSVAAVVPHASISLTAGIMQGFNDLLSPYGLKWLLPLLGVLTAFGALGGVVAWIAGPSKGLLATAQDGHLPPWLQHVNKNGVQTHILIVQGAIVTLTSLLYVIMPSVSTAFYIISALTVNLYLVMYVLLYASAIRLRYTRPQVHREYKVPGGNLGMWLVGAVGLAAVLFAFIVGFFPPSELPVGSPALYTGVIVGGVVIFLAAPFIIMTRRRPSWQEHALKGQSGRE